VLEVAKGRIWTGEQAKGLGLVDALGGLDVALDLAREELGLEADDPVRLKRFPRPRSPWELLFTGQNVSAETGIADALVALQPTVRVLRRLGLAQDAGPLSMPPLGD
jgi:protease-4